MWPNPPFAPDLVTFTEEILNGKLCFLCSVRTIFDLISSDLFQKPTLNIFDLVLFDCSE